MLIHPSLRDVLPPDDRVPGSAVGLGVCWDPHNAIQGVFAAALTVSATFLIVLLPLMPARGAE